MAIDNFLLILAIFLPILTLVCLYFWNKHLSKLSDVNVISFVFVAAAISGIIFFKVSGWHEPVGFLDNFRISFAASFAEDILFFAIFGCVVFYLQRQSWFAEKRLEDRINFLFNAKNLTSEERTYLKDVIAKSAADFLSDKTIVELVDYQKSKSLLKIKVSRQFRIGNYLKEQDAIYQFDAWLQADAMPDNRDAMTVYPISVQTIGIDKAKKITKFNDKFFLSKHRTLKSSEVFEITERSIPIKPGRAIECFYRFEGWVPTSRTEQTEHYAISIKRHWDDMAIDLVNGLPLEAEICIIGPDGEPTTFTLPPGHHAEERWEAVNVAPDKSIVINFLEFNPHDPALRP